LPRREGNAWLLSFRAVTAAPAAAAEDPSQVLSALLPLVVVATAVAALGNPATFSWYSTWALQEGSLD
jgi:bile acid:Na+ symporter, BASS family